MQPTEGHSSGKAAIAGHAKAGPKSVVGDDFTIGSRSPFHSKGPLHPAILLVLLLLTVLPGCATRPGPEVLVPQATAPGARLVTVYVATTRQRERPDMNVFTVGRAPALNYAEFTISIPPGHQAGRIEWPRGGSDPATSFTTVRQTILDRRTFERRIASQGRSQARAGVFVHGFNQNFQEALFRLAQLAADTDIDGVPILFAWPSEARVTGYTADKDAVTYSRDGLAELLSTLAQRRRTGELALIAHSMGGWLAVEALRQLRLTGRNAALDRLDVILAAPDIDVDVFRAQMAVIGPLRRPMTILVSPDDRALSASSRIAGDRPRIGALNVTDPRIQEAATRTNVRFVDISTVPASDRFNHDRFVHIAALYPELASTAPGGAGRNLQRAGAFIFDSVGRTLQSPFDFAGRALAGE
jgi:esterase/lipase superfamily enzyme